MPPPPPPPPSVDAFHDRAGTYTVSAAAEAGACALCGAPRLDDEHGGNWSEALGELERLRRQRRHDFYELDQLRNDLAEARLRCAALETQVRATPRDQRVA